MFAKAPGMTVFIRYPTCTYMSTEVAPRSTEQGGGEPSLVEAGLYASEQEALHHSLVILAMGRNCWFVDCPEGWRLLVEPAVLAHARYQLSCYDRESRDWPPPSLVPQPLIGRMEFGPALLWALTLSLCFWAQQRLGPALTDLCCMDSAALWLRLEYWRPFTALFMHADLGHFIGNVLSGIFIFASLTTVFTRPRAWMLLLSCSVLANLGLGLLNGLNDYRSLGASTAVFTALGLLTGVALRHAASAGLRRSWRRILIPFASGLGLLGLFGAGGIQTDLSAHLAGFLCGIFGGVWFRHRLLDGGKS